MNALVHLARRTRGAAAGDARVAGVMRSNVDSGLFGRDGR